VVSSYTAVDSGSVCRPSATASCFAKLAYSRAPFALPLRCRSRSARAVRPASLAASARQSSCYHSPVKARHIKQSWAFRASKIAAFGHEILAGCAPISECLKRLPVSQRLKSQCVVMQTRSNTESPVSTLSAPLKVARLQPWRPIIEVSASKAKRSVVQQTPNPSFKRTRLRRSA